MLGGAFRWAVRAGGSFEDEFSVDQGLSIAVSEEGLVVVGTIGPKDDEEQHYNTNFNNEQDILITSDAEYNFIVMKLDCWNGDLMWYIVGESTSESYAYDVDM